MDAGGFKGNIGGDTARIITTTTMTEFSITEYKGSNLQSTINGCASKEGLLRFLEATEYAVNSHTRDGNKCQIKFFTDAKLHIEKRLSKF